jgi:hypothetical protein
VLLVWLIGAMGAFWSLVGVLTDSSTGAKFAAVLGLIILFFQSFAHIATWDGYDVANPILRVFCLIAWKFSLPLALLLWGMGKLDWQGAVELIAWFTGAWVVIRLLGFGVYKINEKTST